MLASLVSYLSCPVCTTDDPLLLRADNQETEDEDIISGTLNCPRCNTIYPIIDYLPYLLPPEQLADVHERTAINSKEIFDNYHTQETKAVARIIERISHNCRVSVDVGSGRGPYTKRFHGELISVDLFPPFLQDMRREKGTFGLHYIVADARKLPIRAGTVDLIFCSSTIEHLFPHEAEETLRTFCRLAQRHVLIDVPNGDERALVTRARHLVYGNHSMTEEVHKSHPELDHHSTFTARWFQQQGFTTYGCVGWVSRWRFKSFHLLWDLYDLIAWGNASLGGTLIAHRYIPGHSQATRP